MSYTAEGTIEIPFEDFLDFVSSYGPGNEDKITYGLPRFNRSAKIIKIDFAASPNPAGIDWGNRIDLPRADAVARIRGHP